jgi:hypothetical protein
MSVFCLFCLNLLSSGGRAGTRAWTELDDGGRGSSQIYVILCSVFASLNHVLFGYGELCSMKAYFFFVFRISLFDDGLYDHQVNCVLFAWTM